MLHKRLKINLMPLPLAIPLIMAGIGAATKVGAGIAGGKQMDALESNLRGERRDLEAWYNTQRYQDFMKSDIASAAMNKVLQNIEDQNRIAESSAAVTGATDASKLATKAKSQEQFGDVVQGLASYGTQRRDQLDRTYRGERSRLSGLERDMYSGRAANWANIGNAGGQLINAAAPLFGETNWGNAISSGIQTDDIADFGDNASQASSTFANIVNG